MDAVAAQGSNSNSRLRGSIGVPDLMAGRVPDDDERCLASCPADMAKASHVEPYGSISCGVYQKMKRSAGERLMALLQETRS